MNSKRLFFILLFGISAYLTGDPDCLDNSWHLAKKNDSKEYHSVSCNCPCRKQKILPDRGRCLICGHYRYPRPFIIIKKEKTVKTEQPSRQPENQS